MTDPTITTEQLEAITGMKKSELLTMTRFGIIPKAKKDQWPLIKTIRGIIAHLKDASLPGTYFSIANCSSVTGIPVPFIRKAKKSGCPAFEGSRVKLKPLLEWLCAERDESLNWDAILTEYKAKRERLAHDKESGTTIDKYQILADVRAAHNLMKQTVARVMVDELMPKLEGLRTAEMIAKAREALNRLPDTVRSSMRDL